MSKKRILLTGAAGGIGSAFFRFAANSYTFRLADRNITPFAEIEHQDHEVYLLDITNLDACQQACQDIHTVIHLAADASPDADFYQSLLHNNIQGTYNIFRAAKDQGCQRVIFASSVQVVAGYPSDVQVHAESALKPMNMYGVSKCFGEAVASYFAHAEGLSSIAIRIGAYDVKGDDKNWLRQDPNLLDLSAYVSERDLNQLLLRCVEAPDVPFAIVQGISNNRFKRLDITAVRDLLGYAPQDDSFEIFQDNLQEWLQN
jgi:nucleoside-diphosphate-sugar epimerase